MSSGMFEVLAAAPDEERLARQAAQDRLVAAIYDVREEFGPFLFQAADIREFRDRVALVRTEILNVVGRHLPPVSGVMGRIITRRGSVLEKEFKARQGADYTHHGPKNVEVNAVDPGGRNWSGVFQDEPRAKEWADERERGGGPYNPIPTGRHDAIAFTKGAPSSGNEDDGRLHGPFAGYNDWEDCTSQNSDKGDADKYCGEIYHNVEEGRKRKGEPLTDFQDKQSMRKGAPFADYDDFDDCTSKNSDKGDTDAYCGEIKHQTEDKKESRRQADLGDIGMGGAPEKLMSSDDIAQVPGMSQYPSLSTSGGGPQVGQQPLTPPMKAGRSRRATGDGPPLDTDETFQDHQGDELIPEGDFKGYLDDVDQGARTKIDDNFVDNPKGQEHTENPATSGDFVAAKVTRQFAAFCRRNKLPLRLATLERHGKKLSDRDYLTVAADLQRLGWGDVVDTEVPKVNRLAALQGALRHVAAPDFLQKAQDALTGYLTQQGEQFQETISPYQQMLQTIQQSQALQQSQNPADADPLGVTVPGGINVLPPGPGDSSGGAGAPAGGLPPVDPMGGGAGPTAPPPAAMGADSGGLPPDPTQDPGQTLARRRGGRPKGEPRSGGVVDEFQLWMDRNPGLGRGGEPDVDEFATNHPVGDRAKSKLKQHVVTPLTAGQHSGPQKSNEQMYQEFARHQGLDPDSWDTFLLHHFGPNKHEIAAAYRKACKTYGKPTVDEDLHRRFSRLRSAAVKRQAWMGWGPPVIDSPARKVSGWDWDNTIEAYVANQPGKFACDCGNQLNMPGHHTCKCGKIWNGYDIEGGGSRHEASGPMYLVREIAVRPDVIVANHLVAADDDDDEWPSDHHPKVPGVPATPSDWSRRNHKNDYAPQQLKKRR